MRKPLIRWLPFIVCLTLIVFFSSQDASKQDLSGPVSRRPALVRAVRSLPHVSFRYSKETYDNRKNPVQFIIFCLRKGAHAVIYAALGLSFGYAIQPWGLTPWRRWLLSTLVVVCTGALDELNQTTVPGRTGLPLDVMIDLCGFAAASVIQVAFAGYLGTRRERHPAKG
ncbi:MAG: VanZ family protein [Ignavibacteriales bacterium]